MQAGLPTVQQAFQDALEAVLKERPDVKCCSRTDSGVHANRFCISFSADAQIRPDRLPIALNTKLPPDIRALAAQLVPPGFHARYDCLQKRYIYKVWNARIMDPFLVGRAHQFVQPIDVPALERIAQAFVGAHDFAAMSSAKRDAADTVRTVSEFKITREGALVTFSVTADGFLYNMVRIMVGTLLNAARGKLSRAEIERLLAAGTRTNLCATAPAEGLYLDAVFYPPALAAGDGAAQ